MKRLNILVSLFFAISVSAQEPFYRSYSWEKNPDFKKLETDTAENIIAFKDKTAIELYFADKNNLIEFYLEHRLLWLNSDEIIEDFNKVYLPYASNSELLVNKARVITKEGKIIELDESKILTAKDEETQRIYKYFAFEGIEKGSFIEYYYVVKRIPHYQGKKIILQEKFNKKNVEFDLFSPTNLVFEFKSYNGLKTVKLDTLVKDKLNWKLRLDSLQKSEDEEKAPNNALKQYLIYKLDRNTATNVYGISSYAKISANIYNHLYPPLSKKEETSIKTLVKDAGLDNGKDDISKIRKLENYVKEKFYIAEIASEQLEDIQTVISRKTGNDVGLIRIYIAALRSVGITAEVVVTSDRYETLFDNQFEAGNFLTNYLLYFPSVKMFTVVEKLEARLGFPPPELTDNYGLFIKEVSLGDFKSGVGKIRYIDPPGVDASTDVMVLDVSLDKDDLTKCHLKLDRSYRGYYAQYIQPFLHLANQETLDEVYDRIIKSISENMTIKDKKAYHAKAEYFGIEPFRIVAELESDAFVDQAGKKYLFKLGELIGPQIEMYQEKQRKLPLESDFKRKYERTIRFEIPKGFKILHFDKLNIHHFGEKNGKKLFEFHSYYTLDNTILTVYANEWYDENKISLDIFEDYRKVINCAADFNKIVLVLEPD